jgi:hypothetical protein
MKITHWISHRRLHVRIDAKWQFPISSDSIMCIGFAVEYSTHVSHAYVTSKARTEDGKIREALGNIGTPILQGIPVCPPRCFVPRNLDAFAVTQQETNL